jgi:hypothetical protein
MRQNSNSWAATSFGGTCGCFLFILLLNLTVGAFCFDYSLGAIFGKHVGWFLCMVGGMFLGELTIPLAVVLAIISAAGVAFPLVH